MVHQVAKNWSECQPIVKRTVEKVGLKGRLFVVQYVRTWQFYAIQISNPRVS